MNHPAANRSLRPHDERMVMPTPFAPRVEAMCQTNDWYTWAGYTTPNTFEEVGLEFEVIECECGHQEEHERAHNPKCEEKA